MSGEETSPTRAFASPKSRTFASRRNRTSLSASVANASGNTLIATVRSSRVSRALYTSPIPPAPMGASTS
jgi:hypothetical protein